MRVLNLHQLRSQAHKHIDFFGHSIVDKFEVVDDLHATLDLDATSTPFLEPTQTLQLGDLKTRGYFTSSCGYLIFEVFVETVDVVGPALGNVLDLILRLRSGSFGSR